jgi:hypothetical protein
MTEAELQAAVIDLARVYGWKVAHFRPAQTARGYRTPVSADGRGFPDLVIARGGHELLFVELKRTGGRMTAAQMGWLSTLWQFAHVWTPVEWDNGTILRELSGSERPSD